MLTDNGRSAAEFQQWVGNRPAESFYKAAAVGLASLWKRVSGTSELR
jgi:hypothetical protein